MTGKHTPGPWVDAGRAGYGRMVKAGSEAEPRWIAVAYGEGTTPESEANVRLIAAAPDLLLALKLVLPFIEEESSCRERSCLPEPSKEEEGFLQEASDCIDIVRAAIAKAEGGAE